MGHTWVTTSGQQRKDKNCTAVLFLIYKKAAINTAMKIIKNKNHLL
jgi:hypothetical protein